MENRRCSNFELCGSISGFIYNNNFLCKDCHNRFGNWCQNEKCDKGVLEMYNDLECPICLETKRTIKLPKCNHVLCIECFKNCYYFKCDISEPLFPFPNIEYDYYTDIDNPKWNKYNPLLSIYNELYELWCEYYENQRSIHKLLEKCPLCRKKYNKN